MGKRVAPGETIIEYAEVSKRFGALVVLDRVSCQIKAGETTVILGPSGTGKSVFIKHMVGLLKPDAGKVLVFGQNVPDLRGEALFALRKRFGMLFQDGALFDSMTVGENIGFPLRMHTKKKEAEIRELVAARLASVGLPGIEGKFPSELSGGMRKRVAFARAIILEPEIVLFDEPNSGLDPVMSAEIDALILRLQRQLGITFIVISHDIPQAFQIADTIGMLYKGQLIAYGPKEEIRQTANPILQQFFSRSADGPIKVV